MKKVTIKTQSVDFLGSRFMERLSSIGKPFSEMESVWIRAHACWQIDLASPSIAIVGTRRPTSYGLRFVSQFLAEVSNAPRRPVVISGGALGIDSWAHECALRENLTTESWVVGPIRAPNPCSNHSLFAAIIARGGALLCPDNLEPKVGLRPYKSDWVFRNAYLAARADVILVPEANEKSGTWSTVRWANKMGIPVFALPGPVDRGSSCGTNSMISSGYAHPAQSATKLIQDLVVEGVLDPYNISSRDKGFAESELERRLCMPGGIQVADLPGLSQQLGLKLESLCEYLLNETRDGKLRRVGNGFERRG